MKTVVAAVIFVAVIHAGLQALMTQYQHRPTIGSSVRATMQVMEAHILRRASSSIVQQQQQHEAATARKRTETYFHGDRIAAASSKHTKQLAG